MPNAIQFLRLLLVVLLCCRPSKYARKSPAKGRTRQIDAENEPNMNRFILFALSCMMMIYAPLDARVQDAASSMPPSEQTSPVVVDGRTLFFVRGLSAYPADR